MHRTHDKTYSHPANTTRDIFHVNLTQRQPHKYDNKYKTETRRCHHKGNTPRGIAQGNRHDAFQGAHRVAHNVHPCYIGHSVQKTYPSTSTRKTETPTRNKNNRPQKPKILPSTLYYPDDSKCLWRPKIPPHEHRIRQIRYPKATGDRVTPDTPMRPQPQTPPTCALAVPRMTSSSPPLTPTSPCAKSSCKATKTEVNGATGIQRPWAPLARAQTL